MRLLVVLLVIATAACGGGGGSSSAGSSPSLPTPTPSPTPTPTPAIGILAPATKSGALNDTGLSECFFAPPQLCSGNACNTPTPAWTKLCNTSGLDALFGRDALYPDNNDGTAGFLFTKLDSAGKTLPASAASWACIKDNVTGLIWENLTVSKASSTYTQVVGSSNVAAYVTLVNTNGLCGAKDWRLPDQGELLSLVDFMRVGSGFAALDTAFFINTPATLFWSSEQVYENETAYGSYVDFSTGEISYQELTEPAKARLVRGQ